MSRGDDSLDGHSSRTLAKAILILEAFNFDHPEWGIRGLARELDMHPTSVHRLITTLSRMGYLEQDHSTKRYSLGPRVMRLAALYSNHNPLPDLARRIFEKYTPEFAHSLYLIALTEGFEAVYLAVVEGRSPLKVNVEPGAITGLHSTAAGKVLLAHQSREYLDSFLGSNKLQRYTSFTIVEPEVLRKELEIVREQGFAVNDGEQFEEIGAIAVPVWDEGNQVTSSVSLAYPRHLMLDGPLDMNTTIDCAKSIAAEIMILRYGAVSPSLQVQTNAE